MAYELADFTPMLPSPARPFSRPGWLFELKYERYRILAAKQAKDVRLISRNQRSADEWFPQIARAVAELPGSFILDGEACVMVEHGRTDFEALRMRVAMRRATPPVSYCAFDLLASRGRDIRGQPIERRKAQLRELLPERSDCLLYVQHIDEAGAWLYERAVALGLEGVVGKRSGSRYVGGRTREWLKCKPAGYHDGWRRARPARQ